MSTDRDSMDDFSTEFAIGCREVEGDELLSFRIGPQGNDLSMVGVEISTGELTFDGDDKDRVRATVVVAPSDARRFAASLIGWADECDGETVPLLSWLDEIDDDDDE